MNTDLVAVFPRSIWSCRELSGLCVWSIWSYRDLPGVTGASTGSYRDLAGVWAKGLIGDFLTPRRWPKGEGDLEAWISAEPYLENSIVRIGADWCGLVRIPGSAPREGGH